MLNTILILYRKTNEYLGKCMLIVDLVFFKIFCTKSLRSILILILLIFLPFSCIGKYKTSFNDVELTLQVSDLRRGLGCPPRPLSPVTGRSTPSSWPASPPPAACSSATGKRAPTRRTRNPTPRPSSNDGTCSDRRSRRKTAPARAVASRARAARRRRRWPPRTRWWRRPRPPWPSRPHWSCRRPRTLWARPARGTPPKKRKRPGW